ncbi:hypothetical protein Droror1_Dr00026363 [Drosera rotundifolia]
MPVPFHSSSRKLLLLSIDSNYALLSTRVMFQRDVVYSARPKFFLGLRSHHFWLKDDTAIQYVSLLLVSRYEAQPGTLEVAPQGFDAPYLLLFGGIHRPNLAECPEVVKLAKFAVR